ncbi:MAG: energy transducer TonB [Vicinamibacterales bacterium]
MKLLFAFALVAYALAQEPTIYTPGSGVSLPQATKQVKAEYTEEAKANRIEGAVFLAVVVLADGAIGEVKVAKSLDTIYGLDANAVKAMKQWQFKPGTKDGKPVAVRVHVEMTFSLK